MTIFILDTNVISDIAMPTRNPAVLTRLTAHQPDILCLCEAVDYEVRRGYLKTRAFARLAISEQRIMRQFQWLPLIEADWRVAAQLWADAANNGKVLSDVDLLIAAVAQRIDAVIVSADADFDHLSVRRENWRNA